MSIWRTVTVASVLLSGCGSIAYDDGSEREDVAVSAGGAAYLVTQPAQPPPGPYVTVLPPDTQVHEAPTYQGPTYPTYPAPTYRAPVYGPSARQCSGGQRLRIVNEVVDGGSGPAVVASGRCVVVIDEAIVRGQPAIVVTEGARVDIIESRIQGDIHRSGGAQLQMRGSRHESGRVVQH